MHAHHQKPLHHATLRRLVSFATERGLWAMAAFMLPLASRGAPSVPALLQAIDAVAADGWGLLHKAVLSGDILMAQVRLPQTCRAELCCELCILKSHVDLHQYVLIVHHSFAGPLLNIVCAAARMAPSQYYCIICCVIVLH